VAAGPGTVADMALPHRVSAPRVPRMPNNTTTDTTRVSHPDVRRDPLFSAEEVSEARGEIKRAFELAGLVSQNGHPVCPVCGKTGASRVKLFPEGGWHCFSGSWCHGHNGGAVDLLVSRGWGFTEAVAALLGRPVPTRSGRRTGPTNPVTIVADIDGFKAVCDSDVYQALLDEGDLAAAQRYFARWHISDEAVAELGATFVTDPAGTQARMLERFGRDRLIAAGVISPGSDRPDYWCVGSEHYPLLEPHRSPNGTTVGLQARPSAKREARYRAHLAYAAARRAAEAVGDTFREPAWNERYVGKFSSLRGGQTGVHLIGGGLPRLAELEDDTSVYIVEGLKDLLAMRTLGFEAYALPGVGVTPPPVALAELSRFTLSMAFDADDGGDTGIARLSQSLARAGIVTDELAAEWRSANADMSATDAVAAGLATLGLGDDGLAAATATMAARSQRGLGCRRKRPPQGMDVTDVLVERRAAEGCRCAACRAWRAR
jgi:hypothetical protein